MDDNDIRFIERSIEMMMMMMMMIGVKHLTQVGWRFGMRPHVNSRRRETLRLTPNKSCGPETSDAPYANRSKTAVSDWIAPDVKRTTKIAYSMIRSIHETQDERCLCPSSGPNPLGHCDTRQGRIEVWSQEGQRENR